VRIYSHFLCVWRCVFYFLFVFLLHKLNFLLLKIIKIYYVRKKYNCQLHYNLPNERNTSTQWLLLKFILFIRIKLQFCEDENREVSNKSNRITCVLSCCQFSKLNI